MKIVVEEPCVLMDLLLEKIQTHSKTKIRNLIKYGNVTIDDVAAQRVDLDMQTGQVVEIHHPKRTPDRALPFHILFEDQYLLVVEKPIGVLSMSKYEDKSDTFLYAVNQSLRHRPPNQRRAYLVHRLDREASGIMVFAFSPEIKRTMQDNWDKTEKLYYALVEGRPPQKEGVIQSWLREDRIFKVYSCPEGPDAKYAVTHYRAIEEYSKFTLLEVRLETGRKNQIRVHLSEMGCPIVGDKKYGAKGNPIQRLGLHAFSFAFDHPVTGERMKLQISKPRSFEL
jgi:23S rRNA pseudouridine1911/1915/1917 synthase